jgi:hypothetical protein
VAGEPARLELGSRWAAGIIGVAAVAIAANAMVLREVPAPARTSDGVVAAPDSRGTGPTPQRQLDSTRAAPASVTRIDGSQVLYLPIGGNEPVSARHNRAPVSSGWDTSLEGT